MLNDYTIANLLDHFHMSLDDIRNLTDAQLCDFYFFPRDEQGVLIQPEEIRKAIREAALNQPTSFEAQLGDLMQLKGKRLISKENFNKAIAELKLKWKK
jgi:hypothetical protein